MIKSRTKKKDKLGDMTTGSPTILIIQFAIPLIIGNIFQQVYTVADTMIAGYNIGEGAIAAIGATSSIYSLLIDFASGFNNGCAIVVSRMFGASNEDGLKKTIATMFVLNIAITLILTIVSLWALKPLMTLLSVPPGIFSDAYLYIAVILGGMVATTSYNMFAGILRAVGNSKAPLLFLIFACIVNLAMDVFFIVGLGWGVEGTAVATVIAESSAAIFSGVYMWKKYREILPERRHFNFDKDLFTEVAASGLAMAAMLCLVDFGSVIYQRAINGLGESLIVAHIAARRLIGVFMLPLASIATAYSTFVGQNWGSGQIERVRKSINNAMAMEIGWGVFSGIISLLSGNILVRFLTGTSDPYIVEKAVLSLQLHLICFSSLGLLLALRTALQAMGQKMVPVISSGFELGLKLIAGLWLIPTYGYLIVCLIEPIIWIICTIYLIAVFIIQKPLAINDEVKVTGLSN